jgi:hypothetical protein
MRGLLIDYGGVLMGGLRESFLSFCDVEGLDSKDLATYMRRAWGTEMEDHPVHRFETGAIDEEEFSRLLAA